MIEGATAENYQNLLWTTSGDGTFDNENFLNPIYTLGSQDLINGTVDLTLFAQPNEGCNYDTDIMTIEIFGAPVASAGSDQTICGSDGIFVFGSAENYTSLHWATSGDGAFVDFSTLQAYYIPGTEDMMTGSVSLCLEATGSEYCDVDIDCMNVTFIPNPTVSAGDDAIICAGTFAQLNGSASDYSSIEWATSGDGTFTDNTSLTPVYTPGVDDNENGTVALSLTAFASGDCGLLTSSLNLTIIAKPLAFAGEDATIEQGISFALSDAHAENYASVFWTTFGDGTFISNNQVNTSYFPGNNDNLLQSATLSFTANPVDPCTSSAFDEITISLLDPCTDALADAGGDLSVCIPMPVSLSGYAENQTSVLWETNGDGTFEDLNNQETTYFPGAEDILNANAELCLNAYAAGNCADDINCITVSFFSSPTAFAGEDITICQTTPFINLTGEASEYDILQWETNGTGYFSKPNNLNTKYFFSYLDYLGGEVSLTFAAANENCGESVDNLIVTINRAPTVFAGEDASICGNDQLTTNDAFAADYSSFSWNSSGDGTFDNPSSIISTYYPGENDIQNGNADLCLTVVSLEGCENVEKCFTLTIYPSAFANAGENQTICESQTASLNGEAANYDNILWQTAGDGTFNNPDQLNCEYTPGPDDILNNETNVSLIAYSNTSCGDAISNILITIENTPLADAGTDQSVCESEFVQLAGEAQFYTSASWATYGDGTFSDIAALNSVYYPGTGDLASGNVMLCLAVISDGTCENAEDCMEISFEKMPQVNAGTDQLICETEAATLIGEAENYSSLLWETSGDGTFDNPDFISTSYYPGTNDIDLGIVELSLTGASFALCQDASASMMLTIKHAPLADAGTDQSVCESEFVQLAGEAQFYTSASWATNGDGTFSDIADLNAVYYPGTGDLASGNIVLCLTAISDGTCENAEDCMEISFEKMPQVNAGADQLICETEAATLIGEAENYSSLLWETSGDGTFDNPDFISTSYYPGTNDIDLGIVELCLHVDASQNCSGTSDCMILSLHKTPFAFAGDDATVYLGSVYETNQAQALKYSSLLWETSGSGIIQNAEELTATYSPTYFDFLNQSITLSLTALPISPCAVAYTDELILSIEIDDCVDAIADAGEDTTVCVGNSALLAGVAYEYSSVLWSTQGNGTFDNPAALETSYYPGTEDLVLGNVHLYLLAEGKESCANDIDTLTITLQPLPVVYAGSDNTVLFDGALYFQEAWVENADQVQWTCANGLGQMQNDNEINMTYLPSPLDVGQEWIQFICAASPINPCISVTDDEIFITFVDVCADAFADAGSDIPLCTEAFAFQLSGNCYNYASLLWSTSGDGTFDHPNTVSPKYTMGTNDHLAEQITLYITAQGFADCATAIDSLIISPQVLPEVSAGPNQTICGGYDCIINASSATNYSTLQWTTSGNGTFSDNNAMGTSYTPGSMDINAGFVNLTLTAESLEPCNVTNSSFMRLEILKTPEILVNIEDKEAKIGDDTHLVVIAKHADDFQWFGPNGIIPGEDQPVLLLYSVGFEDDGYYYCEITNECGTISSSEARIIVYKNQLISIPSGWSGLSSYITPHNNAIEHNFEPYLASLTMVKNYTGIYYPAQNVNTLQVWDEKAGYEVNFSNAVTFEMRGIENTNKTIQIGLGWQYLPVISQCPVSIAELFAGQESKIDIIKEIAGVGMYWPALGINTIGALKPGSAYKMRACAAFSITFPECQQTKSGFESTISRPENLSLWNNIQYSPASHNIAIDVLLSETLMPGDILGAFTANNVCAGYLELTGNNDALTLFGDDPLTATIDGFLENETIRFKIYRPSTGEEFELNVAFDNNYPSHNGAFLTNGLSRIIKSSAGSTGILTPVDETVNIYPNPSFGEVYISGLKAGSRVEVWNSVGQKLHAEQVSVAGNTNLVKMNLSDCPTGLLFIRIYNQSHVQVKKIILK
ncbi:MAG: T9SS type A sorting domain-containing protein [Bacteroidales bacterium]|nr:T9SS type A sorting domain-containing protein [Bacteroidales bacterium]